MPVNRVNNAAPTRAMLHGPILIGRMEELEAFVWRASCVLQTANQCVALSWKSPEPHLWLLSPDEDILEMIETVINDVVLFKRPSGLPLIHQKPQRRMNNSMGFRVFGS